MVLVTSASRKLPLLRAIRADLGEGAPGHTVVAADSDANCLASYAWNGFVQMPRLDESTPDDVIDWLAERSGGLVVPTRDADVVFLSTHATALLSSGVRGLTGSAAAVEACVDKLSFAEVLRRAGLPAVPTSTDASDLSPTDRYVVKERFGAGSVGLAVDVDRATAMMHAQRLDAALFQPFVSGRELSIDAYRTSTGKVLGIIVRSRDLVVNGESQVSTVVDSAPYIALVRDVLDALELTGHCLLQLIDGERGPVVIECNPRLGGASTLALAAGLRTPSWFALEAEGRDPSILPFVPRVGMRLVRTPWDTFSDPDPRPR